jgi:hypothetical protein
MLGHKGTSASHLVRLARMPPPQAQSLQRSNFPFCGLLDDLVGAAIGTIRLSTLETARD